MKLKIIIFTFLVFISVSRIYGQQVAPLSDAYLRYMEQKNSKSFQKEVTGAYLTGYIPSPLKYKSKIPSALKKTSFLPQRYDLRDNGSLTQIRNQGQCGACWAFAAMAAVEAKWKMSGYGSLDLSENNLKNKHGFVWGPCDGGNTSLSTAYFTRGGGPVLEPQDPYGSNGNPSPSQSFPPVALIDKAFFLPDIYSENDAQTLRNFIKQFIYDNGPVTTAFYMNTNSKYYNSADYTYYSDSTSTNHEVLIVGWDDNKVTTVGKGAWIIKNSWGENFGEKGFFYISYFDKSVLQDVAFWPERRDYSSSEKLYMYDDLGETSALGWMDGNYVAYGIVKFVSDDYENISTVSTYATAGGSKISIEIYDDFDGNVLSNKISEISEQYCSYAGYYTFNLPSPIKVSKGNDFYIKVRYNTPGYDYSIPIECYFKNYSNPKIETGKYWISHYGGNYSWIKVGADVSTEQFDLCIRAYGSSHSSGPSIWPGDANNDGQVNVTDVLSIGLNYKKTGVKRTSGGCSWQEQFCSQSWSPENAVYADCDGSGEINASDVLCVGLNYGKTHNVAQGSVESNSNRVSKKIIRNNQLLHYNLYDINCRPTAINKLKTDDEFFLSVIIDNAEGVSGLSFDIDWNSCIQGKSEINIIKDWENDGMKLGEIWCNSAISLGKAIEADGKMSVGVIMTNGEALKGKDVELLIIKMKLTEKSDLTFDFKNLTGIDKEGNEIELKGAAITGGISKVENILPETFQLSNYPNPFNPTTRIQISIPKESIVSLSVYNVIGQEVTKLLENEKLTPGVYEYTWCASDQSSGIYYYKLQTENSMSVRKMTLLK